MKRFLLLVNLAVLASMSSANALSHRVVYYAPGEFSGWPANKGGQAWHWGDEMLVAFVNGAHRERNGHDWAPPLRLRFARSTDGGVTWTTSAPRYVAGGPAPGEIDFAHPDFALMVFDESRSFFVSYDRGRAWWGPYGFGNLMRGSPVAGDEFSARTDYLVDASGEALLFLSSRRRLLLREDYTYVARTRDGGATFEFVSFLDPFDLDRQVMPSTVRIDDRTLLTCVRRRSADDNWIECYRSRDDGATWRSLGQVDSTGESNGSPPALVRLPTGELVCVYAVRRDGGRPSISAKVSIDDGASWGPEQQLRTDYADDGPFDDVDMGYPRAFVRADGKVVAVYYWATAERPEQHIAATVFEVEPFTGVAAGALRRGLRHERPQATDRMLLMALHYVENGSRFKHPRVRYGGQPMIRLLERDQNEGDRRAYVAVFYLGEREIARAAHERFEIDWQPSPPDNWEATSVFLGNVEQADPFGRRDTGATKSAGRLRCAAAASGSDDAAVVAATARKQGRFVLDRAVVAEAFPLRRGGIARHGAALVGVTTAAGPNAIRLEHGDPGSMAAACVRVRPRTPAIG